MCKGVAVLVNFKEVIICSGSSHSNEVQDKDDYLALIVIYDDTKKCGYRIEPKIEPDMYDNEEVIEHYYKKQFFLNGKPNPELMYKARKEIRKNEAKIFRVLCKNMYFALINGNQVNYSVTIKGDQRNYFSIIKGDQYNDLSTIKNSQHNDSVTIGKNQVNYSATIKGDQYNFLATIKGDQYNDSVIIKGSQDNSSATIEGDIIIYKMKYGSTWLQELLDDFSSSCNNWKKATLENFVKWLLKKKKVIKK